MPKIKTITIATTFCILSLLFIFGCAKKESGDVSDMFARAQQFQMDNKHEDAIRIYRKIVSDHEDTREAANSQFMIGYIYANHLKDLEKAQIEFTRFLAKYDEIAEEGLVFGARFELEHLGKSVDQIPFMLELDPFDDSTKSE